MPVPVAARDQAVGRPEPLADGEQGFAACYGLHEVGIAIDDAYLREDGIRIDVGAAPRPGILLPPQLNGRATHDQQVGIGTGSTKRLQRHTHRRVAGPIDPALLESGAPQAVAHITGRIIELRGELLGLPLIDPGARAALLQIGHLVTEVLQTVQILQVDPGVTADRETADAAGKYYLHPAVPRFEAGACLRDRSESQFQQTRQDHLVSEDVAGPAQRLRAAARGSSR